MIKLHSANYTVAIDPIDSGYCPWGEKQIPTLLVYFVGFWCSGLLLWLIGEKLSPLIKALSISYLCIGAVISLVSIFQLTHYADPNQTWSMYSDPIDCYLFCLYPVFNIVIAIILIIYAIQVELKSRRNISYKNRYLNTLNAFVAHCFNKPVVILLLALPVLVLSTIILILFGQSPESLVQAFTDTTCWRFSQMSHPDYLPHQGHYLCTVAARGDVEVVKPLRFGKRHGKEIIVNRQLLVANAFEYVIENRIPYAHTVIRNLYDKYGLPLSKYINTPRRSNLAYYIMKPLEFFFILILYTVCVKPEEIINRQYA